MLRLSGRLRADALMTVHVDLGVLTGETPSGRCRLEDGPALSSRVARGWAATPRWSP